MQYLREICAVAASKNDIKYKKIENLAKLLPYSNEDEEVQKFIWEVMQAIWNEFVVEASKEDKKYFESKMKNNEIIRLICMENLLTKTPVEETTEMLLLVIERLNKPIYILLDKHKLN